MSFEKGMELGPPPSYLETISKGAQVGAEMSCEDYEEPDTGPRADQYKAFSWFEKQGWKSKWPLHFAAMKGDIIAIMRLVKRECLPPDQKMTDWYDSEPVGWAASFGQLGALRCLIDLGAYPFTVNKAGNDALKDAKRERHEKCIAFLEAYKKSSDSRSAKIASKSVATSSGARSEPGTSALESRSYVVPASANGIKAGDYVEPGTGPRCAQRLAFGWFESQGWTSKWPVHHAAMKGDVATIIHLVRDKGIPPDQKMTDWFDSEPVGWAASFGQLGALRCLIDLGAYPFTVNKASYDALTDARRERHGKCIAFLEEYKRSSDPQAAKRASDQVAGSACCVIV